ncbi:peptidoglycan DD-metalloendopeptidase family protein [Flavobacterium laiguense]|uniref:Peptidase M23 n=1 Tax=Flavobacterium laiguense TaxID=2169409 RepID=A0A2U1JK56_9FLAO|nr:peptidoglycan DD-metalloendopeptidase family protein [Flavobacterium laiguense]PWA05522.1 peptidase M23 [Flavobacterium laiguense]
MKTIESILKNLPQVKVIDDSIEYNQYTPLDLSASNLELNQLNISNATEFETFIESHLDKNNARVAHGGYNETRNLYKRSTAFNDSNSDERNIHIGLDLWIKAGTPVLAALDGKVHSFQYNNNIGDYGPTIILEHLIETQTFYTLYGHLSLESIASLKVGDFFEKGATIATLGGSSVNGDYAPHLHFQIIKNIKENFGDYTGVCSKNNLDYYLENCPDPNLLLKIQ